MADISPFAAITEQHAQQAIELEQAQKNAVTELVIHLKGFAPLFDLFRDDTETFNALAVYVLQQARTIKQQQLATAAEAARQEAENAAAESEAPAAPVTS